MSTLRISFYFISFYLLIYLFIYYNKENYYYYYYYITSSNKNMTTFVQSLEDSQSISPVYAYEWCSQCQDNSSSNCYDPKTFTCSVLSIYTRNNNKKRTKLSITNKQNKIQKKVENDCDYLESVATVTNFMCAISKDSMKPNCWDTGELQFQKLALNNGQCPLHCQKLQQQALFFCRNCQSSPRLCSSKDPQEAQINRIADTARCYQGSVFLTTTIVTTLHNMPNTMRGGLNFFFF
ncbi:hypothetical protein RFI_24764 [Reticulomyxa filosa]|uniref:Transmembrane protein n=1 Tax=Reticulomyxa filosa TaxID=46433 RepID=X6MF08_RETFI|nr:hypothetical protein RFI_24764 [Reticulomyxa filosa]|eukprot:ETO12608.1 hypothetical protein RFI_24764 [Reticulomyxa filosa]